MRSNRSVAEKMGIKAGWTTHDAPLEVRRCGPDDLSKLEKITSAQVAQTHYAAQELWTATLLVAWQGDEPLGFAMAQWTGPPRPNARAAYPKAVEINHLFVRRDRRGQGAGSALIAAAEELAREANRTHVSLGVADDNPRAATLYGALGYRHTGIWDVTAYDHTTENGEVRHEVERDELLVKDL